MSEMPEAMPDYLLPTRVEANVAEPTASNLYVVPAVQPDVEFTFTPPSPLYGAYETFCQAAKRGLHDAKPRDRPQLARLTLDFIRTPTAQTFALGREIGNVLVARSIQVELDNFYRDFPLAGLPDESAQHKTLRMSMQREFHSTYVHFPTRNRLPPEVRTLRNLRAVVPEIASAAVSGAIDDLDVACGRTISSVMKARKQRADELQAARIRQHNYQHPAVPDDES